MKLMYLYLYDLKHTYVSSSSSRIILNNLKNCPGVDLEFKTGVELYLKQKDFITNKSEPVDLYLKNKVFTAKGQYYFFKDTKINKSFNPNDKIVLLSCTSYYEIYTTLNILDTGSKLVIGGTLINLLGIEKIRNILLKLNKTKPEYINNNLIIVEGLVTLKTDLKDIITKWDDYKIPAEFIKSSDIYNIDHEYDLVAEFNPASKVYTNCFQQTCHHWKKCTYCEEKTLARIQSDFDANAIVEKIKEAELDGFMIHNYDCIYHESDYYIKSISDVMKQNNMKFGHVQTSFIKINKEHIQFLNDITTNIFIGLETCSDFGLKSYNKGYDFNHVNNCMDLLIKYLNKDVTIEFSIIVDLPVLHEKDIINSYNKLIYLKHKLKKHGFNVLFNIKSLRLTDSMPIKHLNKNFNISVVDLNNEYVSGLQYLNKRLLDNNVNVQPCNELFLPYMRTDINGNSMYSDFEYMEKHNLFNEMFGE
jgi:hypothetical protein